MANFLVSVISLAVGIAGIVAAVMVSRRKVMRYAYEREMAVYLDDRVRNAFEVNYKGVPIEGNIDQVKVRLCNGGNREIRESDFVEALNIAVGRSGHVLEYALDEIPDSVKVQAAANERSVGVTCGSLNPRDSFRVTMLLSNWDGEIEVKGKILGAKVLRYPSGAVWKAVLTMVSTAVMFGGLLVSFLEGHAGLGFLLVFGPAFVNLILMWTATETLDEFLRIVYRLPRI